MSRVLLSATGASRRFGSFRERRSRTRGACHFGSLLLRVVQAQHRYMPGVLAVDDADLEVRAGEVVGLLGANGAGKTTLIRMLLGLLHPSAGRVLLLGEPPSRRARARLGYVPQGLGLYEDLTVAENLAFTAQAFGGRAEGPLPDPELEAVRGELVAGLPLGLRRRLAFAAALGHRPELLVLDEPTSGVDALGRARLWDAIRSAAEDGAGVLVTTHSMEEAERCDRLVVMAAGRVVAHGTVDEIIGDATTVAVRGTTWQDAFAACDAAGLPVALVGTDLRVPAAEPGQVRAVLRTAGIDADVTVTRATLEEAFVLLARSAAA